MDSIIFVLSNSLAIVCCFCIADRLMRGREPWRKAVAATGAFALLTGTILTILGTFGAIKPIAAMSAITALTIGAIIWRTGGKKTAMPWAAPDIETERLDQKSDATWHILALALLAGLWGTLAVRCCFDGSYFMVDAMIYHASAPARWLQTGHLVLAPDTYQAYYPYNAELLSLWFMLPWQNDTFASLSGLYWPTLAIVSMMAFVKLRGASTSATMLAGLLFLASPVVWNATKTYSVNDLAAPACVLAAIALAVPALGATIKQRRMDAVCSGLIAGFAIGVKVSHAPFVAAIFLWWLLSNGSAPTMRRRLSNTLLFCLCAIAMGGYWYTRNLILTGNPLFPAELGPLAGPFDKVSQFKTTIMAWFAANPLDVELWSYSLKTLTDWPILLFVLAAAGYGAAMRNVITKNHGQGRDTKTMNVMLILAGLAFFVCFLRTPFSGSIHQPQAIFRIHLRFFIILLAVGIMYFVTLVEICNPRWKFWRAVAIIAAVTTWPIYGNGNTIAFAIAILAVLGQTKLNRLKRPPIWLGAMMVIVLLSVMAIWAPAKKKLTDQNFLAKGQYRIKSPEALSAIDKLPAGSRIASFGFSPWAVNDTYHSHWSYPMFGRNLQLTPIHVNLDGSRYEPLHVAWRKRVPSWWGDRELDMSDLAENLKATGANYVITTKFTNLQWPPQDKILCQEKDVKCIYRDEFVAIYEITKNIE